MVKRMPPVVSVVVPVFNSVAYLDECLASIAAQSIGFEAIEVVAIDDGSTDGSADRLDEWAARHTNMRVLHQANSGAPGGPRNRGIDVSTGEYLFFADPDDYLGVEAFERMLEMARRNDSDIVLGRIKGVGRVATSRPFRRAVERGDVVSTDALWSLTAHKLFRRALIVDNGLRFAEGVRLAEEQPLVVPAYFLAKTISVVADYDCYYLVLRPGAPHLTRQHPDPDQFFAIVAGSVRTVVERTKPGPERDGMLKRWAQVEILGRFGRWFPELPAPARERYTQRAAEIVAEYIPAEVFDPLPALDRVRAALVRLGRTPELTHLARFAHRGTRTAALVEGGRVYAGYPYFRDPAFGIPDGCYDITGELALDHCPVHVSATPDGTLTVRWSPGVPALREPALSWSVVLRGPEGRELTHPADGTRATVALATIDGGSPLPSGRWVAHTRVTDGARQATLAIGEQGTAEHHPGLGPAVAGGTPVDVSLTGGVLAIAAGDAIRPRADLESLSCARGRLTVTVLCPWPITGEPTLHLTRTGGGPELTVPATQRPGGPAPGVLVLAEIDLRALARAGLIPGRWQCTVGPAGAPPDRRAPIHAPATEARGGRLVARSPVTAPLWSMAWLEPSGRGRVLTLVIADWRHVARRVRQRGRRAVGRFRRSES